jgi:hypothetical protein
VKIRRSAAGNDGIRQAGGQPGSGMGSDMTKQVMIVEDNELNMKLFRDLIEASGYKTIQTRNGLEAMDLARKHRPGPDPHGHPAARSFRARSDQMAQAG